MGWGVLVGVLPGGREVDQGPTVRRSRPPKDQGEQAEVEDHTNTLIVPNYIGPI